MVQRKIVSIRYKKIAKNVKNEILAYFKVKTINKNGILRQINKLNFSKLDILTQYNEYRIKDEEQKD